MITFKWHRLCRNAGGVSEAFTTCSFGKLMPFEQRWLCSDALEVVFPHIKDAKEIDYCILPADTPGEVLALAAGAEWEYHTLDENDENAEGFLDSHGVWHTFGTKVHEDWQEVAPNADFYLGVRVAP